MAGLAAMFAKYDEEAHLVTGGGDDVVRQLVANTKKNVHFGEDTPAAAATAASPPGPSPAPSPQRPPVAPDLEEDENGAPRLDMSEDEIKRMLSEYENMREDEEWVKNPYYIPMEGEGDAEESDGDTDDPVTEALDEISEAGGTAAGLMEKKKPRFAVAAGWEEVLERENEELRRRREVENEEMEWEVNGEMRVLLGMELTPGGVVKTEDRKARDHPSSVPAVTAQGNAVHAIRKRSLQNVRKKQSDPNAGGVDTDTEKDAQRRGRSKGGGKGGFLITECDTDGEGSYDSREEATVHDQLAAIHANDVLLEFPSGRDSDSSDGDFSQIMLPAQLKPPAHLPAEKAAAWEKEERQKLARQRKIEERKRRVEAEAQAFKQSLAEKAELRAQKTAATKPAKALQGHLDKRRQKEEDKARAEQMRRREEAAARQERLQRNEGKFLEAQERNLQREKAKASKYDEEKQLQLQREEARHQERAQRYAKLKQEEGERAARAAQRKASLSAKHGDDDRALEEKAREARRQELRAKVYKRADSPGRSPGSAGGASPPAAGGRPCPARRKPGEGYDGRHGTPLTHTSKPRAIPTPERRGSEGLGEAARKASYDELRREKIERDEKRRAEKELKEQQLKEQVLRDDAERAAKQEKEKAAKLRREEEARAKRLQAVQDMKAAAERKEKDEALAAEEQRLRKERIRDTAAKNRRKVLRSGGDG
eukprot:TRINITY_DN27559_c0_g1_i1.p1 TRINITY_DN27559_c0_g1~~TRINITY_DN27559_c0_g1_i1.p1  ORF type:complete len:710 (+),score=342.15 TRINITY_DN27559_c0_g1_i1:103-2232(+)